jgi:hypothetical protein
LVRVSGSRLPYCGILHLSRKYAKRVFGLFKPKNPEEHRYYLLPGMGKSNRRQRQLYFRASIIVGVIIATIVGLIIYFAQRPGPSIFN